MNKILKKVVSIGILASMICYTTPIFAFTKDETVYSKADASGKNYKTIVSTHLENLDKVQSLSDLTNLINIENINGDETFTQDGKSIVWDAKGNDIYYQGESKEELPVSVEIKYELDGKTVTPEEVAGKTGKVTITVTYKNNDEHKVNVNGSYETMYTPFVVVGGTIMHNNNKIEKVTNAIVINDGTKCIVVGIFFPGLQESLGISKLKLEIPTEMKITVDAKDFEMGQILTFATPTVMDNDSTNLINVVKQVSSKLGLVQSSTKALQDGANELNAGIEEYNQNAKAFNGKMKELSTGVSYMNSQYTKINSGIAQVEAGTEQIQTGVGQLKAGIPQIQAGINQITTGIGNKDTESTFIYALSSVDTGLQGIITTLSNATTTSNAAKIQALTAEVQKNTNQITALQARNIALGALNETDDISAQIELNNNVIALLTENNEMLNGTIASLQATDATAIDTLVTGLTTIDAVIQNLEEKAVGIKSGLNTINGKLDSVNTGITGVYDGLSGVLNGINKEDGLKNGSNAMKDGLNTLDDSTAKLTAANTKLTEGSGKITEGAGKLASGMTEFNTQISNVLNGGISQIASRAQSLVKLSEEYKTFAETSEEINGRTKFIIMTDKLRKED